MTIQYTETAIVIPLADLPPVQIGRVSRYRDEEGAMPRNMEYSSDKSCDDALREVAAVSVWRHEKTAAIQRRLEEEEARRLAGIAESLREALGEHAPLMSEAALRDAAAALLTDDRIRVSVRQVTD